MRLIGMTKSPYVRRVAISLSLLELPFTIERLSSMGDASFQALNPVMKAPTLETDDGLLLLDSSLILDHCARLSAHSLSPESIPDHARATRILGLALAACDKAVQAMWETVLRPAERTHLPWLERVQGQMIAAVGLLEADMPAEGWLFGDRPHQADITSAVVWEFVQRAHATLVPAADHPRLASLAARAEALPVFQNWAPD